MKFEVKKEQHIEIEESFGKPLPTGPQFTKVAGDYDNKHHYSPTLKKKGLQTPKDGIYSYLTIEELADDTNSVKKGEKGETSYLKGIYKGGTKGEHCSLTSDYLAFDIDKKDNPWVKNNSKRNRVLEVLSEYAVVLGNSNSGLGLWGFIHVPNLSKYEHKDRVTHKRVAEEVYAYLSGILLEETEIEVDFDNSQGAFRHVRYSAHQNTPMMVNYQAIAFSFEVITYEPTIPATNFSVYVNKDKDYRGTMIDQFNRDQSITPLVLGAGFEHVYGTRYKHPLSASTTSGEIKGNQMIVNSDTFKANNAHRFGFERTYYDPVHLYMVANDIKSYVEMNRELKRLGYSNEKVQPTSLYERASEARTSKEIAEVCFTLQTQSLSVRNAFVKGAPIPPDLVKVYKHYLNLKELEITFDQTIEIKDKVSEKIEQILDIADQKDKIALIAPTGSGKTTAIINYSYECRPDARFLVIAPLSAIALQAGKLQGGEENPDVVRIVGTNPPAEKWRLARSKRVVITNYEHAIEVLRNKRNAFDYIVIDELHSLVLSQSYRARTVKELDSRLQKHIEHRPDTKIIGMTGTPLSVFKDLSFHTLKIEKEEAPIELIQRHDGRRFTKIIKQHHEQNCTMDTKVIYRALAADALADLSLWFKSKGYKEEEVAILTGSSDKMKGVYGRLVNEDRIPEEVKVVLTSPVIDEGVSILNEDFEQVVYIDGTISPRPEPLRQFLSRFRNPKSCKYYHYQKVRKEEVFIEYAGEYTTTVNELKELIEEDGNVFASTRGLADLSKFLHDDGVFYELIIAYQSSGAFFDSLNNDEFNEFLLQNFNVKATIDHKYKAKKGYNVKGRMTAEIKREVLIELFENRLEESLRFLIETTRGDRGDGIAVHTARKYVDIEEAYYDAEDVELLTSVQKDFIEALKCFNEFCRVSNKPKELLYKPNGKMDSIAGLREKRRFFLEQRALQLPKGYVDEKNAQKVKSFLYDVESKGEGITQANVRALWKANRLPRVYENDSIGNKTLQNLITANTDLLWLPKKKRYGVKDKWPSEVKKIAGWLAPIVAPVDIIQLNTFQISA